MSEFQVSLFPSPVPVELFGRTIEVSPSVLVTWGIIAVVLVLALLFRFIVVPRMKDQPRGVQHAFEAAVEALDNYIGEKLPGASLSFGAYIFSLALLLLACTLAELFGFHPPSADITMTLAISLITFFLVNYYGFKRKGLLGRIKRYANPFHILSDVVAPVSLACRLFGNMFGGMIIIDLLYHAMGKYAVALPSVAGLYFNAFHPLIQTFIFITLTLAYIQEAVATD